MRTRGKLTESIGRIQSAYMRCSQKRLGLQVQPSVDPVCPTTAQRVRKRGAAEALDGRFCFYNTTCEARLFMEDDREEQSCVSHSITEGTKLALVHSNFRQ
jgi:hypothetical protein